MNNYFSYSSAELYNIGSLPAPMWRKEYKTIQTLCTGESVLCDQFKVKIPKVEDSLISDGKLYVQFGRISDRDYTYNNATSQVLKRGNGIKWCTPMIGGINPFNGSGEIGGNTDTYGNDRNTIIQITQQNELVSQAVPYWTFYKTVKLNFFNADISSGGYTQITVPVMTGTKIRRRMNIVANFLPGGGLYKKKFNAYRDTAFSTSLWVARLLVIENGRVVAYGATSEYLQIRANEAPYSDMYKKTDSNVAQQYVLREFNGKILV